MAKLTSVSAAAFLLFGSAGTVLAESANFEMNGFPISLHQAQVTGAGNIRESTPAATLMVDGMPASTHQVAVLAPRRPSAEVQVAAKRLPGRDTDASREH
jgi:hypothetical protein